MSETLVILGKGHTAAELEALATVRQRYGDRVLIVSTTAPDRLGALGTVVPSGGSAPETASGLSPTELMGIAAWNARQGEEGKQRPGEGLNWDTEGYEAP